MSADWIWAVGAIVLVAIPLVYLSMRFRNKGK